ncbi:zinc aminopeptidase, M28 family [Campylobacter mucosalis]|uniref:DUF4910 domain-containing protein n=1 Tax=Campylobacter mucosalis TaxID=202 RepID=UPI0006925DA7|nr:DUF4910 domain-containing protein [Campylobacter mucosalis]QKF62569.1 zinc aminopeptidase, M28 family [Campylobacter mucosalis]
MLNLAKRLFKIPRSITGDGFKTSLKIVLNAINGGGYGEFLNLKTAPKITKRFKISHTIKISSVKSGTRCYDWVVPDEWVVRDAYILTSNGRKICEFKKQNLHLVNYSCGVHKKMSLNELKEHLYTDENLANAVPYVTSYYEKRWGFCISKNELDSLEDGVYEVFIDSNFKSGELNYAEIFIPATKNTKDEILITSYLCHPQMANNELSGPVVLAYLARWVMGLNERDYNYRFVLAPETIGSICFIYENFSHLKQNVKGGFVLSCVGDEREYSVVLSPSESSLSDKIALHTIKHITKTPKIYSFLHRGSDERQFNTPNLDLGMVCICRSKFGEYKEYHTSLDDFSVVTENGLNGGLSYAKSMVLNYEINKKYALTTTCEPNLGSRGLISTINKGEYPSDMMLIRDFLAFCDGKRDVVAIAEILGVRAYSLKNMIEKLLKFKLIKEVK